MCLCVCVCVSIPAPVCVRKCIVHVRINVCVCVCVLINLCVCVCVCVCLRLSMCFVSTSGGLSMWASVWWGWQTGRHLYGATYLPSTSCTADPDEDHKNLVFSMHVHVSMHCGEYQSRGRDSSFTEFRIGYRIHVWSQASHLEPC